MNNDLISRSALLEDLEESVVFTVREGVQSAEIRGANKIIARIKAAPAADAEQICQQLGLVKEAFEMAKADLVPVVRCEKCVYQQKAWHSDKRRKEGGFFMYSCELNQDPFVTHVVDGDPGGFCSEGKRRADK